MCVCLDGGRQLRRSFRVSRSPCVVSTISLSGSPLRGTSRQPLGSSVPAERPKSRGPTGETDTRPVADRTPRSSSWKGVEAGRASTADLISLDSGVAVPPPSLNPNPAVGGGPRRSWRSFVPPRLLGTSSAVRHAAQGAMDLAGPVVGVSPGDVPDGNDLYSSRVNQDPRPLSCAGPRPFDSVTLVGPTTHVRGRRLERGFVPVAPSTW